MPNVSFNETPNISISVIMLVEFQKIVIYLLVTQATQFETYLGIIVNTDKELLFLYKLMQLLLSRVYFDFFRDTDGFMFLISSSFTN